MTLRHFDRLLPHSATSYDNNGEAKFKMGGCLSRKTGAFDPQKDLNDLTGKVAIVTGAKCVISHSDIQSTPNSDFLQCTH